MCGGHPRRCGPGRLGVSGSGATANGVCGCASTVVSVAALQPNPGCPPTRDPSPVIHDTLSTSHCSPRVVHHGLFTCGLYCVRRCASVKVCVESVFDTWVVLCCVYETGTQIVIH